MNWRQWIGLKPTEADLAHDLLRAGRQSSQTGWVYDAADSSLHDADRVINLVNLHREYAQASYLARPGSCGNTKRCSLRWSNQQSPDSGPSHRPGSSPFFAPGTNAPSSKCNIAIKS
jgi:hypothetical protein